MLKIHHGSGYPSAARPRIQPRPSEIKRIGGPVLETPSFALRGNGVLLLSCIHDVDRDAEKRTPGEFCYQLCASACCSWHDMTTINSYTAPAQPADLATTPHLCVSGRRCNSPLSLGLTQTACGKACLTEASKQATRMSLAGVSTMDQKKLNWQSKGPRQGLGSVQDVVISVGSEEARESRTYSHLIGSFSKLARSPRVASAKLNVGLFIFAESEVERVVRWTVDLMMAHAYFCGSITTSV